MGKGSYKVFKAVVNEILLVLPIFGESGSELSYFIPEPRHFAELNILSEDINKPWLKDQVFRWYKKSLDKRNMKEIKNIINSHHFLVQDSEKGDPVGPCMDVYKAKVQSDGHFRNWIW